MPDDARSSHDTFEVPLSGPPFEKEVRSPMKVREMFVRGLPKAARQEQGKLSTAIVPCPITIRQRRLRFDPKRIEAYRRVCMYESETGRVPLPYPEIHFTPLMAEAIVSGRFPLSPIGLIHTRQAISVHDDLRPSDVVDLTASLSSIRETSRGFEVDFALTLERSNDTVWSGITTVLSRTESARSGGKSRRQPSRPAPPGRTTQVLSVRRNTGVAFARVSGDWNPHHLWWFTAKPLGYRRPIAHGMWTFARAVTVTLRGVEHTGIGAAVSFKRPLLMPGRIAIEAPPLGPGRDEVPLAVRDARTQAPHIVGQVRRLAG